MLLIKGKYAICIIGLGGMDTPCIAGRRRRAVNMAEHREHKL